jgi:hypothetical protein
MLGLLYKHHPVWFCPTTLNNFWSALYLGAQAVALFTPPTLVVKLGIVTAVASFGIIGLRSEGCLPV